MISKPCYNPVLRPNPNGIHGDLVEVAVATEARILSIHEEIPEWCTAKVGFFNTVLGEPGIEFPELCIRFSTKLPPEWLLKFRRVLEDTYNSTQEEVDEIHEMLLYSPEGRASIPTLKRGPNE